MADCQGNCPSHLLVVAQISEEHKRTEELYVLIDKLREDTDVRIERALLRQKEYLQEVMRVSSANTKLWIIGQGFAVVTFVAGVVKLL